MSKQQEAMRSLPSVEKLLQELDPSAFHPVPRPVVADLVRREVANLRKRLQRTGQSLAEGEALAAVTGALLQLRSARLQPVINATGVLIHTNLGRSPVGTRAADALRTIATSYNNLELDLLSGGRGKRAGYLEQLLATLTGAPAAVAVNNCASALVLILKSLISGERNEMIVSRGELVEIGGGFRVPEIMEASGAVLVEVGATNKTRADDYREAIGERTAAILKVHRSNFWMGGFTGEPTTEELSVLADEAGIPLVEDLGSGAVMQTDQLAPIEHEPTPMEVLGNGVGLVCFSGDKLLGGPQSGIIAGKADLVAAVKREPFFRAVRCDKLILTVLQETVSEYLAARADSGEGDQVALPDIPVVRALATSVEDLRARAHAIVAKLEQAAPGIQAQIIDTVARTGGGTMPRSEIPSIGLIIKHPEICKAEQLATRLRLGSPPVVGYVEDDSLRLDLRTVFPAQDPALVAALAEC
jgi:L-seryl-tRNA(Ser) seleniumtransferase